MTESFTERRAKTRKTTECVLRESLAHNGHKHIAEAVGFNPSNMSRLLSGEQNVSFERMCAIIDAAGLKLVPVDDMLINPEDHKAIARLAIKRLKYEAGL